jgi:hypothetical protein
MDPYGYKSNGTTTRKSDKTILIEFYKRMEKKDKEDSLNIKLILENIKKSSYNS